MLKQACADIEGIFLSILLKEGLQASPMKAEAETPGGHEQIQGYAIEQAARDLGQQGSFGIADALYEELSSLK
ncbi:MAG: hypothetical protein HY343_09125 [Lentisphaerae bacterium]|nr:hypothetical protein [Lentisphaerota bacterium]